MKELGRDGVDLLNVEGGNSLVNSDILYALPQDTREFAKKRAGFIAGEFARQKVAAMNVGRFDLSLGAETLAEIAAKAGLSLVSCNVQDGGGKLVFPAYRIVDWGGVKTAVIGVTKPVRHADEALKVTVGDPVKSLQGAIDGLPKVDLVVCLSDLGYKEEHELLAKVAGVHILVGGGDGDRILYNPIKIGKTLLLRNAERGRNLGVVDFKAGGLKNWSDPVPEGATGASYDAIEMFKLGDEAPAPQIAKTTYKHNIFALGDDIPYDDDTVKRMAEFDKVSQDYAVQAKRNLAPAPLVITKPVIPLDIPKEGPTGSNNCIVCHGGEYARWVRTGHSKTVVKLKPDERVNPKCQRCHMGMAGEGTRVVSEPFVGCEVCHGVGGGHPEGGAVKKFVAETVCFKCHSGYHNEKFDLQTEYNQIRCNQQRPPKPLGRKK